MVFCALGAQVIGTSAADVDGNGEMAADRECKKPSVVAMTLAVAQVSLACCADATTGINRQRARAVRAYMAFSVLTGE